jgi:hypothetical protein
MNKFSDSEILNFIKKQLNASDFNSITHTYLDEYTCIQSLEDNEYVALNKKQITDLMETTKEDKQISSLEILSRADMGDFITVSFIFEFKTKVGKIDMSGRTEGITVLLIAEDELITIFDAQSFV